MFFEDNVALDKLKHAEYNPRTLTAKKAKYLQDSIDEFGLVEPIVANSFPDRLGVIIGGNQRYELAKRKGDKSIPVVWVNIPDIEKERELNLRLNKNTADWNLDLLANYDENFLKKVGFDQSEINRLFDLGQDKAEFEFATELLEEHNYIVFYFDNLMDWNSVKDLFELKTVKIKGDKTNAVGVNRVVAGKKLLEKIKP